MQNDHTVHYIVYTIPFISFKCKFCENAWSCFLPTVHHFQSEQLIIKSAIFQCHDISNVEHLIS